MTNMIQPAWNAQRFAAWTTSFGSAEAEADRIVADPERIIRRISPHIRSIAGKKIWNVQGSHGRIAVALALLGTKTQVIDFSKENRHFALDLAAVAGVSVDYVVCDIMKAGSRDLPRQFDTLVLELGILHDHQNLDNFFTVLRHLTADDGLLLLNEFHPIQRKLFDQTGLRTPSPKTL